MSLFLQERMLCSTYNMVHIDELQNVITDEVKREWIDLLVI